VLIVGTEQLRAIACWHMRSHACVHMWQLEEARRRDEEEKAKREREVHLPSPHATCIPSFKWGLHCSESQFCTSCCINQY
jgi:hypothetical protein